MTGKTLLYWLTAAVAVAYGFTLAYALVIDSFSLLAINYALFVIAIALVAVAYVVLDRREERDAAIARAGRR